MGFYRDTVVPRIVDRVMGDRRLLEIRRRVCAGLTGEVLEIGFGSGLNVGCYPPAVTAVTAVEPSDVGWRLAGPRVERSPVPVRRSGLDGQSLPFPDDSFDSALSTWTLCTIPDASAALREIRRVLRPGAVLHFVEHGRAPDAGVERWQHRLEPLNRRVAGGCHLSRPIDELVSGSGLRLEELQRYYHSGEPKPFGAMYEGRAAV